PIRSEGLTSTSEAATTPPTTTGATTYAVKAPAWPTTTAPWTVPPVQYTVPTTSWSTTTTAKAATTVTTAAAPVWTAPPTTQPVWTPPPTAPPTTAPQGGSQSDMAFLACVRRRESGGNYSINTGNGYYGAYQFAISTWNATAQHAGRFDLVGLRPDL